MKLFGEEIEVKAEICRLPGISGHADREGLLRWIQAFEKKPQKVFVVHGEDQVTESFASYIHEEAGVDAYAPFSGDAFDLITGEQIKEGSKELVQKKEKNSRASSNVFARLVAAGQRLLTVIGKCEGLPNKELARFADQINALCNKWER